MLRLILCSLICFSSIATAAEAPLVAVASNLTQAMTEIADHFQATSGIKVKLSFGSSGNFTRQILQGAHYQLFLAADKKSVDLLRDHGQQLFRNAEFARGRIGFFIPVDSHLSGTTDLQSIVQAIEFEDYRRLVIANPEVAPYGLAAVQALTSAGIWIIDRKKLLLGENAAQAVQFSLSGSVDIGIIPAAAAREPKVIQHGRFFPIPESWHQPIQQYLLLLSDTNPAGARFYNYLLNSESQGILIKFGYTPNVRE